MLYIGIFRWTWVFLSLYAYKIYFIFRCYSKRGNKSLRIDIRTTIYIRMKTNCSKLPYCSNFLAIPRVKPNFFELNCLNEAVRIWSMVVLAKSVSSNLRSQVFDHTGHVKKKRIGHVSLCALGSLSLVTV